MIRAFIYALVTIVAITFLRMVMGVISRGFSDLLKEETKKPETRASGVPTGGELKPCRKCGTYVVASAALKAEAGGETSYYCSDACRDAR
jgi:hypothetical protein